MRNFDCQADKTNSFKSLSLFETNAHGIRFTQLTSCRACFPWSLNLIQNWTQGKSVATWSFTSFPIPAPATMPLLSLLITHLLDYAPDCFWSKIT